MAIYQIHRAELFCDQCDGFMGKVQASETALQSIGTVRLLCPTCGGVSADEAQEHTHSHGIEDEDVLVQEEASSKHP